MMFDIFIWLKMAPMMFYFFSMLKMDSMMFYIFSWLKLAAMMARLGFPMGKPTQFFSPNSLLKIFIKKLNLFKLLLSKEIHFNPDNLR
jgi:hypothetical protein